MVCPVLNAFVDDGGEEIVIIDQLENGGIRERRIPAQYTTYHRAKDIDRDLMRTLKRAEQVSHVAQDGADWIRIGWKTEIWRRQGRWKFKEKGIVVFEGDVDPVRWWLTESKFNIARPRRCYLDIETDSRVSFSKKEEMRVLCWTISNDEGSVARGLLNEDDDDDEMRLLSEMWKVLENYDQVCAWYGGDPDVKEYGFDFYVIAARSRRCGLTIDTRRWLWLDQLVVWKRMNSAESGDEKESLKLEDVAQHQLGEGKEQSPDWVVERFGKKGLGALAWELWAAGGKFRQLLVDYCAKDTELLRKLEKRKGFLTLFQTLCEVCAVFGNTNGLFPTGQMDGFLLRLGRQENYRFPTKLYSDEKAKKEFEGAFVLAPRTVASRDSRWTAEDAKKWRDDQGMTNGILRNVHVCDFASLYPSNIITWNLSEETRVVDEEVIERCYRAFQNGEPMPVGICRSPGTGLFTYTDKPGILPLALRVMLQMRKKYSDEAALYPPGTPQFLDAMARSTAYKVAANSFYGVVGARTSRYFNKQIAESTTQNGVWLIKRVMAQGEKRNIVSVAGDTDSAFTVGPTRDGFNTFIKWLNDKDLPKAIAATGVKESFVKLAYEKAFDILVFSGKKRYIGRYNHYKWKTTCTRCKDKKGNPGSVDVRTLLCESCKHQYTEQPTFIGKPEIKGLEYRRGDTSRIGRAMQGKVIDLLVGGLHTNPDVSDDLERPVLDLSYYEKIIKETRDRVMSEPLTVEDVRQSKGINKDSLKEYATKEKANGEDGAQAPHVLVAHILESRGQSVSKGTRIEYVTVDGDCSPMKVIPAEDYKDECDRYYLWDTLIYPPTQRLLEGAFPDVDWEKWGDIRPKKVRGTSKVGARQLGFLIDQEVKTTAVKHAADLSELAVPVFSSKPLVIGVPEEAGDDAISRVNDVLKAHPGARTVHIHILLKGGSKSVLKTPHRVATGERFREAIECAITGG